MDDAGRLTSYKRKELGASQIGNLIDPGFITPNQVMENALNEYKGEEVGNDIANLPKVKAGRFMETGITNLFMIG